MIIFFCIDNKCDKNEEKNEIIETKKNKNFNET